MDKIGVVNLYIGDVEEREKVENYAKDIVEELKKASVKYGVPPHEAELALVFGGDGTMLEAKEMYWMYNVPLLGLDFGHKGFMMNPIKTPAEVASRIVNKKYKLYSFPLLTAAIGRKEFNALNDVYFNRIGGKSCRLSVRVNRISIAERIVGDGFNISTALGSTGYNFAAGGSAIFPELAVVSLTPVSVHAPIQLRPMVFPLISQIEIEILNLYEKEIAGWYDGFDLPEFKKIKIQGGKHWVKLAFWEEENFTERLVKKIMKVQEG